ncbi:DUF4139 domain-containing protein [Sphingomonas jeddahensis]|uniref:DUF4139 domain-containing protein n=1 Tax=Sphingomonas jeddahensis TaxID=1915074 RepID=UPI001300CE2C|nr:hypothetical protein [Sphingomonas jeddahensis]
MVAAILASFPSAAPAQTVVTSDKAEKVAVTLYRAPDRPAGNRIAPAPQGFALITETRTITLPAGPAVIRFEGVAGNIMPETAIVAGLPQDVAEKNLDADLLSPRTLYDRALGRRVLIRRTDPATGRVREEQATIRSGASGAAVLEVAGGFEALRCSGLPETIVQPSIPSGLSARPTLSISTSAPHPATATITLSYLAGGFDWQADYVLTTRRGSDRADLTAWATLASSDVTSLANARTQLVAGKPNREEPPRFGDYRSGALSLRCWPTTVTYGGHPPPLAPPPPPPPPPVFAPAPEVAEIVVTSARRTAAIEAVQGEIGDLKLYTVPVPVTIASQAQKQVALASRAGVAMGMVYVSTGMPTRLGPVHPVVRLRNRKRDGLGLPLPAGRVAIFQEGDVRPVLLGETSLDDKAVDEDVELDLPPTPGVSQDLELVTKLAERRRYRLTVNNANPWPITYEAQFSLGTDRFESSAKLAIRGGRRVWSAIVPANGRVTLDYALRPSDCSAFSASTASSCPVPDDRKVSPIRAPAISTDPVTPPIIASVATQSSEP